MMRWITGLRRGWGKVDDRAAGLGVRKRLQLLMGGLILLAVFFVLALTVVAALSVLVVAVSEPLPASDTIQRLVPLLQTVIYPVVVLLGGLTALSGIDFKREIREIGLRFAAVGNYRDVGGYKRAEVVAEVENALEAISESPERYGRVFVVGYSFAPSWPSTSLT